MLSMVSTLAVFRRFLFFILTFPFQLWGGKKVKDWRSNLLGSPFSVNIIG